MSYPTAGLAKVKLSWKPGKDYPDKVMVPHGISVIVHAPAVFEFTASADPERHRLAAKILGAKDAEKASEKDVGKILSDTLLPLLRQLSVPDGLSGLGYTEKDIPSLVEGTLPQQRVVKLSPIPVGKEELTKLFTRSMKLY